MKRKAGAVRQTAHRYTFQTDAEIEAIALAQLGQSNRAISQATAFTDGQVTYLLGKAKRMESYKNYHTYRSEWRDGSGAAYQAVANIMLPRLRTRVEKELPKHLTHPTPKVAPNNEPQE